MFLRLLFLSVLVPSADGLASSALMDADTSEGPLLVLASPIPMHATPEAQLSTSTHTHHQLLRVKRDFGDPWRDIVVDAWVPKSGQPELTDVRLWWINANKNDRRNPFGKKTKKKVSVTYNQRGPRDWQVGFGAGSRKFFFDVTMDEQGNPAVYGDIRAGRKKVEHCKVDSASLYAKKILDVTIGLDRLEVSCVDDQGQRHTGNLRRSR